LRWVWRPAWGNVIDHGPRLENREMRCEDHAKPRAAFSVVGGATSSEEGEWDVWDYDSIEVWSETFTFLSKSAASDGWHGQESLSAADAEDRKRACTVEDVIEHEHCPEILVRSSKWLQRREDLISQQRCTSKAGAFFVVDADALVSESWPRCRSEGALLFAKFIHATAWCSAIYWKGYRRGRILFFLSWAAIKSGLQFCIDSCWLYSGPSGSPWPYTCRQRQAARED